MPPRPEPSGAIDLNILPERYRPKVVPPTLLLVWGIAVFLLVLVLPMVYLSHIKGQRAANAEVALQTAQIELRDLRTPEPAAETLAAQMYQARDDLAVLQSVHPTIMAPYHDWEAISAALLVYDPARIRLTQVDQDLDQLTVRGLAAQRDDVLAYADQLENSGVFERVLVQSMHDGSVPFETASAATIQPTTAATTTQTVSPTSTRAPYDAYEIDDFEARLIIPGEIQWRNFNPAHDIDRAVFTGRAGKRYCILALPQALGVDTILEVTVAGQTYRSENCQDEPGAAIACRCPADTVTGTVASLVEVQIASHTDQQVHIKTTNRGIYGPDMWYTLLVQDTAGDAYEPDDTTAAPIAVGETQSRSFYPDGDVDRVRFAVKAGRAYELRTTNLAIGVDTVLTVSSGGVTYSNDDIAPGDASSRVAFVAATDGTAYATITNKGLYGPEMTYSLQLLEGGGDAFEPDDYQPGTISVYERQRRTFYPQGDVDRIELQTKAGRTYEVRTYDLAVGVDTVLSVLVDGVVYQNDDIQPGDLSSRVVFTAARDGVAAIAIMNRDQYGPDKEYWVTVRELAGTPTPDFTLTPDLRTPTVDCGDPYEPDDHVARMIAVGAAQARTFCPAGDVDRVVFTAKAGYSYQIETANLAVGVDTHLRVQLGSAVYTNDDRAHQDLSSLVRIQNLTGADAPVFVTVTNKGLFGPDMTYSLRVSDAGHGDPYEPDDAQPVAIALGYPQARTFYPAGDVDRVTFVAKRGQRYRIYTQDLAPGVDTRIVVEMGSIQHSNDDRQPGDLSSYLELQNTFDFDAEVIVSIYNKGSYGPDKSYTIQVDDLGAEGADSYEPDLEIKRYISVGEVQYHTFFPAMDVDRVWLRVKEGRSYVLYTCGNPYQPRAGQTAIPIPTTTPVADTTDMCLPLAPGADTVLVASGPITACDPASCQSDDAYPGTGMLNSWLSFEATADGEVSITIYNKGSFGPTIYYYLVCEEVGAAPNTPIPTTASPTATATPTATYTPSAATMLRRVGLAAPLPQIDAGTTPSNVAIEFALLLRLKSVAP